MVHMLSQVTEKVLILQEIKKSYEVDEIEWTYIQGRLSAYIEMKDYLESELTHISSGGGYLY